MENGVFPKDPVKSLLGEHFVEARLHTDKFTPHRDAVLELQDQLVGSKALPVYIVVDPANPTVKLAQKAGAMGAEGFAAFLRSALPTAK